MVRANLSAESAKPGAVTIITQGAASIPSTRIFAEGAFSQAFVPILAEYKSKQGEDATRVFVAYVSGLLTLALAIVTVLGMLAAPWVIMVTAPGFADSADKFAISRI